MALSVDEARARILAGIEPTGPEIVALAEAWGRVAARAILARINQPPRDVSAMDGYALRTADAAAGAVLGVMGSAPAGHPWDGRIAAGQALRVFTGSVMPEGADTVLLQEDARRDGDLVTVVEAPRLGRHIRRAGQDFAQGDALVEAGRRLSARDVGLIAAGNHAWVTVHRRPRVGILATGDEIVLPGEPIPAGGLVSSNAHALAALVRSAGGAPVVLPIAPDDLDALSGAIDGAAGSVDLLVTTGGASVGDHDLVREALAARGIALDFWKVAMRPGRPLMHGRFGTVPVIGLPGNPVSAIVTALLFVLPAVDRLGGGTGAPPPLEAARLAAPLAANDERTDHLRAQLARDASGEWQVTPFERQDSAMLRTLALADALIVRPPHAPALGIGASVAVMRLDPSGSQRP